MADLSTELTGLQVMIDRIVYVHDSDKLPLNAPHAFIYFITIINLSKIGIILKGRRWVICDEDGSQKVIEGQGIVGKEPHLKPGEKFSYNSYHMSHCNTSAEGSFHGIDDNGKPIYVRIPRFDMNIPNTLPKTSEPTE